MTDIGRHLSHARTTYYRRATAKAIDANAVKLRAAARHVQSTQPDASVATQGETA